VTTTRDGAVALVTLTRPARANALDGEITDALLDAVRSVRDDDGVPGDGAHRGREEFQRGR